MIDVYVLLLSLASSPLSPVHEEIAKSCRQKGDKQVCQLLLVGEHTIWYSRGDPSYARAVGPYLRQYQAIVARGEAPTRVISTRSGWKIIATRGSDPEQMFGPVHFYCFVDRRDAVRMKATATCCSRVFTPVTWCGWDPAPSMSSFQSRDIVQLMFVQGSGCFQGTARRDWYWTRWDTWTRLRLAPPGRACTFAFLTWTSALRELGFSNRGNGMRS